MEYISAVTVNVGIQCAEMSFNLKNYTLKKWVRGQRQHVFAKFLYIYTSLAPHSVTHYKLHRHRFQNLKSRKSTFIHFTRTYFLSC